MPGPWLKFYPTDWQSDPLLGTCSLAARGLWIEMLCVMHSAEPAGSLVRRGEPLSLPQIAILARTSPKEAGRLLDELETAGVFSRDEDGAIFSRRMRRDLSKAERDRLNGRAGGGNPTLRKGTVPKDERVRPFKRSDAPNKTRRIFDKNDGRCHWCNIDLIFDGNGVHPQNFHVDHVVAVCDGGTNDESNLVAACAGCNHDRARIDYPTRSQPRLSDHNPDSKAQIPEARSQRNPSRERGLPGGKGGTAPRLRQAHPPTDPCPAAWDPDAPFGRDAAGGVR